MKTLLIILLLLPFAMFSQSDSTKMGIDTSLVYDVTDVEPRFPGGAVEMARFLSENFVYTDSARIYGENQKVIVEFVIMQDGTITNAKIIKGQKFNGQEVLRVIRLMPNWTPGEIDDIKVKVKYTLPFMICLG